MKEKAAKLTKVNAPDYIGWRFIADGNRQGYYDKRLVGQDDWNDDGALPDNHPAWLDDDSELS